MSVLRFLLRNWDSVLLIVTAVVSAVEIYKRGETKILKDILFRLVTKAEAEYGSGTGELERAAVIEWLYERMPGVLRLVVTQKDVDSLIDEVLAYAKEKWANNPNLRGIVSPE